MQDTTSDNERTADTQVPHSSGYTSATGTESETAAHYYDRHAHDLPPLLAGDSIRMRLPGQYKWTAGHCTASLGQRSYGVKVGEYEFQRNCRHLLRTNEQPLELELPIQETEILAINTPEAEDTDS